MQAALAPYRQMGPYYRIPIEVFRTLTFSYGPTTTASIQAEAARLDSGKDGLVDVSYVWVGGVLAAGGDSVRTKALLYHTQNIPYVFAYLR